MARFYSKHEGDPWWFAPWLYVGVCLAVAGLVLADLLGLL